jgi:Arc/MetJ-type ribon-helix-helix transcriptional regulator
MRILSRMTTPVPTRFSDEELTTIDWLVTEGVGGNRSDVIRRAVELLNDAVRRRRIGETIAESYRSRPQSGDDDAMAMANAVAMTEAEPW